MSVKLPTPLPYDYVDQLIDDSFEFFDETYTDHEGNHVKHFFAHRTGNQYRGNFSRLMFSFHDTGYDSIEEDEDGFAYIEYDLGGMNWRAEPLTDKELEYLLENME